MSAFDVAADSPTNNNATGGLWPPANFDDWPLTRISALVYLGIVLLFLAVCCA